MGRTSCVVYAGLACSNRQSHKKSQKPVLPSPGDDRAGGGTGQVECMDDAPAMRGMFFVLLIPFVLWFLSLLPLLILHLVVVVIFFLIIHHPLIHSYRVC